MVTCSQVVSCFLSSHTCKFVTELKLCLVAGAVVKVSQQTLQTHATKSLLLINRDDMFPTLPPSPLKPHAIKQLTAKFFISDLYQ